MDRERLDQDFVRGMVAFAGTVNSGLTTLVNKDTRTLGRYVGEATRAAEALETTAAGGDPIAVGDAAVTLLAACVRRSRRPGSTGAWPLSSCPVRRGQGHARVTDVLVDRLRIRGASGRRMAAVAARALPDALDNALTGLADTTIKTLSVRLHLDPDDYDDQTLALLWADAIRAAALTAGARPRVATAAPGGVATPAQGAGRNRSREPHGTLPTVEQGAEALRAWLDTGASPAAVPAALAPADPAAAAVLAARLGSVRTLRLRQVVVALSARVVRTTPVGTLLSGQPTERTLHPRIRADHTAPTSSRTAGRGPARAVVRPADDRPHRRQLRGRAGCGRAGAPAGADMQAADLQAADMQATDMQVEDVQVLLDLLTLAGDAAGTTVDLTRATRAAGLVLLYPWLADLCVLVESLEPTADVVDVRRRTLAALADPDDPSLVDDPLVVLLAGANPDLARDAQTHVQAGPLGDEAVAAVEVVLARFAALLRGFERSSPAFIRSCWIIRSGLLDPATDPVQLVAETLPLDVLLPLLPYPVSLLRLPWSRPVTVRFVP